MSSSTPWRYADSFAWMDRTRSGFGPAIITCAVNGGIQGRESHPALPETPEQIAEQAREAVDAGASIVHIHGRCAEDLGRNAETADVYREINARVREACPDVIVNNSSGGGPQTPMDARFDCLQARPEMASLNLGPDMSRFRIPERPDSLPDPHPAQEFDTIIPFTYGLIDGLATTMRDLDIKPEMELYHSGMFGVSRGLIASGLLKPPYVHQFVMGYQTAVLPTPGQLLALLGELPDESLVFVCGIGQYQLPLTTFALLMGAHVRVGLEDNLYFGRGRKFTGNGEAVARVASIAESVGRPVATPAQAREILGLAGEPRVYS